MATNRDLSKLRVNPRGTCEAFPGKKNVYDKTRIAFSEVRKLVTDRSKPLPPLSDYQNFLEEQFAGSSRAGNTRRNMTAPKLRSMVRMLRSGHCKTSIARTCGISPSSVYVWLKKLPPELAP